MNRLISSVVYREWKVTATCLFRFGYEEFVVNKENPRGGTS